MAKIKKQIFKFTLDNSYVGTLKYIWTVNKNRITLPEELLSCENYFIDYNGETYTCNYNPSDGSVEGKTKIYFMYRIGSSNALGLVIAKTGTTADVELKSDAIDFVEGAEFFVYSLEDAPEPPAPGDDELVDDTYEIDLRSTTTFNRYAIVDTEVTMKKPDEFAKNYVAEKAVVKVNGVEISGGGGGYPEPTGTLDITANGIVNVKDYAEANVNVESTYPEGTLIPLFECNLTLIDNVKVNISSGNALIEAITPYVDQGYSIRIAASKEIENYMNVLYSSDAYLSDGILIMYPESISYDFTLVASDENTFTPDGCGYVGKDAIVISDPTISELTIYGIK